MQAAKVPVSRLLASQDNTISAMLLPPPEESAAQSRRHLHFLAIGDSAGTVHVFRSTDLVEVS